MGVGEGVSDGVGEGVGVGDGKRPGVGFILFVFVWAFVAPGICFG